MQQLRRHLVSPVVLLLLFAALLKAYDLSTNPLSTTNVDGFKSIAVALVVVEILISIWLILEIYSTASRISGILLFSLFAIYSICQIAQGETSCDCFGQLRISPSIMLVVDLIAIIALIYWTPKQSQFSKTEWWYIGVCCFVVVLAVAIPIINFTPNTISDAGYVVGDSKSVFLQPENWVGKELPLLPYIRNSYPLNTGQWTVIFYRNDCEKCQELFQSNDFYAANGRRALVDITSTKNTSDPLETDAEYCTELSPDFRWFVDVPTIIQLDNQIVVAVDKIN